MLSEKANNTKPIGPHHIRKKYIHTYNTAFYKDTFIVKDMDSTP